MPRYRFGDIVKEVKENIDRANNPYACYVAGEHMDTDTLEIRRRGTFENSDVGPAFIRVFHPGQILYGSRRTYLKKVAVADFSGITSNTTFVLEAKDEQLFLHRLLPFLMLSDRFTEFSIKNSKGSTNPYILFSDLAQFEVDVPEIEEQRQLADLLWAYNEAKNAYLGLMTSTDALVKSQFIEMFGDLGSDEKGWGLTTLGACCEINPRRSNDERIASEPDVSFVAMPSVSEDGKLDATVIRPYSEVKTGFTYFGENDVLFAKITPCMENGKGAIAKGLKNGIGFGSTEFHVIRPQEGVTTPCWIYTITMFDSFRHNAEKVMTGTGGQRRVPASYLSDFVISVPPLELQNRFAAFVESTDKSEFATAVCRNETIAASPVSSITI